MRTPLKIVVLIWIILWTTSAQAEEWRDIVGAARGQTVYFNAWGGSDPINDYIRWAGLQVKNEFGVTVKHVKVTDIGDVVSRILAEKSANRNSGGSVDLMWINGENFKAMKGAGLLFGPFTQKLPNYRFVDTENKPTVLYDFTTPVDQMEAPWGMAQLIFMIDTARVDRHPEDMSGLLDFARQHPGRVTYPAPPSIYGTTFVKQALLELATDRQVLYRPVSEADFEAVTAPLWAFLDKLHPLMRRNGKVFTRGAPEMKQLLNDGEIFISLSFNPNDASHAITNGELPDTVRTYVHRGGTIANTHFVAIPFNSNAREGAMVFADFLMSPTAQLRKAIPSIWGDSTVLAVEKLNPRDQKAFRDMPLGIASLSVDELGKVLLEPDASWVTALEKAWLERYQQ
jgi:putative thiamine transport system substrate-binding protein